MKPKFCLAWLAVMLAACTTVPTAPSVTASPAPLPTLASPRVVSTRLTASLTGLLVKVGSCVRVGNYLLVPPPDFGLTVAGDAVQVVDRLYQQQVTVRLGDTVQLGGGEIKLDEGLSGAVPAGCPGPYWVVGSLPEKVAPSAAATPELTRPPTATNSAPPTATPSPTPPLGVTEVAGEGVITFTSTVLGLAFSYRPAQLGATVRTLVSGDRVYVYYTDSAPTGGQYVQVYHKAPTDSLAQAIRKQFLQGYDPQDCLVTSMSRPDDQAVPPSTYIFAMIMPPPLPTDSPSDLDATHVAQEQKCPSGYTVFGGDVHFMEDTRHPDRFFFFKIGQYSIFGAGPGEYGYPWQDTLRVLDAQPASSP